MQCTRSFEKSTAKRLQVLLTFNGL